MTQVTTGRVVMQKGPARRRVDMVHLRTEISRAWNVHRDLVVSYADRMLLIPGTPYVEWRVFDAPDRVYVDWLIHDLSVRGGHGAQINEVLGFLRSMVETGRIMFDDDHIPLHPTAPIHTIAAESNPAVAGDRN